MVARKNTPTVKKKTPVKKVAIKRASPSSDRRNDLKRARRLVSKVITDMESMLHNTPLCDDNTSVLTSDKEHVVNMLAKHSALLLKLIPLEESLAEQSAPKLRKRKSPPRRITKHDVAIMRRYVERVTK